MQCNLHPGPSRGLPSFLRSSTHVPTCIIILGWECAFEYLTAFPSRSSVTELNPKAAMAKLFTLGNCVFVSEAVAEKSTQDVAAVLRSAVHPAQLPLISLTRQIRGKRLLGGSGQVTRRRGAVASQGQGSLCWERKGEKRPWASSRGKIDFCFLQPQHSHCVWFYLAAFLDDSTCLQYKWHPLGWHRWVTS